MWKCEMDIIFGGDTVREQDIPISCPENWSEAGGQWSKVLVTVAQGPD